MSRLRHGDNYKGFRTVEYTAWVNMKRRCDDPNFSKYRYHGGRGIRYCDRWWDFENFLADMGRKSSPELTLERIDNNGDYTPENCRWESWTQQSRNRSYTKLTMEKAREIRGLERQGYSQRAMARMFDVTQATIWNVINNKTWKEL
jgi:hypothetical protein